MRPGAILLAFGLLGATARADVALVAPVRDGRLPAGLTVAVTVEGLPDTVDEIELFLVPAPGARPLRLTGSEERSALLSVTLPNVELARAVLRLRVGDGGEERWAAESEAFALLASPLLPAATVDERAGEEWLVPDGPATDRAAASAPEGRMRARVPAPAGLGARADELAIPVEAGLLASVRVRPAPGGAANSGRPSGSFQVPLRR